MMVISRRQCRYKTTETTRFCAFAGQLRFTEMALEGDKQVIQDRQGCARDTKIGAFTRCWQLLCRTCAGLMMGCDSVDMSFICHIGEVEYARKLRTWFRDGPDNGKEMSDLMQCCLYPFSSNVFLVRDAESFGLELDLEVRQRCKCQGFFVGWHNDEVFAFACETSVGVCDCSVGLEAGRRVAVIVGSNSTL